MPPGLTDSHNHLHDPRLAARLPEIIGAMRNADIERCVVNGTNPSDWPEVARLAEAHPDFILPAFGLHPWYAAQRPPDWLDELKQFLDRFPHASIGECGLDRTRNCKTPLAEQQTMLTDHLHLAAERSVPTSLHCVRAWGALVETLTSIPLPSCGFLVHSYSGSLETAARLVPLGAYISFSGRALFHDPAALLLSLPPERILVESDAPDLPPPAELVTHPLAAPDGSPLNHPANLPAIAEGLARAAGLPVKAFIDMTAENSARLFGTEG